MSCRGARRGTVGLLVVVLAATTAATGLAAPNAGEPASQASAKPCWNPSATYTRTDEGSFVSLRMVDGNYVADAQTREGILDLSRQLAEAEGEGVSAQKREELRKAGEDAVAKIRERSDSPLSPAKYKVMLRPLAPSAVPREVAVREVVLPPGENEGVPREWMSVRLVLGEPATGPLAIVTEPISYFEGEGGNPVSAKQEISVDWEQVKYEGDTTYDVAPDIGDLFASGGNSPALKFKVSSGPNYDATPGQFTRTEWIAEGTVPLGRPDDVPAASEDDASKDVGDYIQLTYGRLRFQKGGKVTRDGLVVRTTGRLECPEIAYHREFVGDLSNDSRTLIALGGEIGVRNGSGEWVNVSTPAPDRGPYVLRALALGEWAPHLGPVNRNLAEGLRFYMRGRGWADMAEGSGGDTMVRFRGYFDTEAFWNFDDTHRVYLRFEHGALPPDLSETVSRFSVGVGEAF